MLKSKKIVIFTGPSGVGKATIENNLLKKMNLKLEFSISATTRKPRKNELNQHHYYFLSKEEFDQKIINNEFVEWNEHFSNKYGTLKSEVDRISNKNKVTLLELDVVGAINVLRQEKNNDVIAIFIAPPSIQELKQRLISRATETTKQIEERLQRVDHELAYKKHFHHVFVNNNIEKVTKEIEATIEDFIKKE